MITIEINEKTKAGKALVETAKIMAEKHKGIIILQEDGRLLEKIRVNHKNDYLTDAEAKKFIGEIKKIAGK